MKRVLVDSIAVKRVLKLSGIQDAYNNCSGRT